ncbi:Sec-independent protein translocase protein TatB [Halopseudomonas yangmingensis]|uniref:Sec-independent protein translocase protein TatB n=1 Tax=Halopseudomonas yangmingensis TaxID=1720063 RepID=A0A1I4RX15_9GAMM|nr:Sec-independent protein translocase protein TatB [Halopseudomonas yangmingensis]SFM56574.1 sec-independent protein translocase protein TatB [Halopseudomonas yangmingensis]
MFDIGFIELLVVAVIGLLVLGPERLPGAIRGVSSALGKLRSGINDVREQVERELGADEIRQKLHNDKIMAELAKMEKLGQKKSLNELLNLAEDGSPLPPESKLPKTSDPASPEAAESPATVPAPETHEQSREKD